MLNTKIKATLLQIAWNIQSDKETKFLSLASDYNEETVIVDGVRVGRRIS